MKKKKNGVTLIEMIIVLALMIMVLSIISSMFINGSKVFSSSDVKSALQIETQKIQEKISKIGMESIGIDSIEDEDGDSSIDVLDKNTELVDVDYDEVKSKLTDIDGTKNNEDLTKNKWLSIREMKMSFYEENDDGTISMGTPVTMIEYRKDSDAKIGTLLVDGKEVSANVESIRIKPGNIDDDNGTFKNTNSILINIVLSEKKGYSNVEYPISIDVKFRNRFIE
ncbi:type II secretion system protein [Clostridium beijerinckii]|uniref:Type II secretion system protein n=1 Tax=Clostridium beijerinckii TaxID=1520 RepID=A0A7X9SK05_CLOBE|nr:type II secretion system protein [Clostridium beijerinckii]